MRFNNIYKGLMAALITAAAALGFTACDDEQAYPPFIQPEGGLAGDGSWETPYTTNSVIALIKSADSDTDVSIDNVWVTGYVVGWVNTNISYTALSVNNCIFSVPAEIGTNCLIAATPDEKDYNNCVVVQLSTTGNVRSNLSLVDHPENLGKLVSLRGTVTKYFGKPGLKSTTAFNWDGQGTPGGDDTPSSDKVKFTKATSITSGKAYGLVAAGKLARPCTADRAYGYLYVTDVTVASDAFTSDNVNGFVFTDAGSDSWYISDCYGRFLYMEGTYTSFQLSATLDKNNAAYRWKAAFNADGTCVLTNAGNNKTIQYSGGYTSYGAYDSMQDQGAYPVLYLMDGEPVKLPDTSGNGGGNTPDQPVTPPSGGAGSEASPYSVAQIQAGSLSGNAWVKGYIVGFIPGKVFDEGVFTASGAVATNVLIADKPNPASLAECAPVQLPSGAVRTALNLKDNPTNLGKEVMLLGSLENYFGKAGVKAVTEYKLDGNSGGNTPTEPVTPPATDPMTFVKTSSITSGAKYAFVNPSTGDVCIPIAQSYTYGYLLTEKCTASGNEITTSAANAFTITAVQGGYTVVDSYGRYMGMDGEHAGSFQLYKSAQSNGGTTWTITFEAGGIRMTNVLTGLVVVWKSQYSNFAPAQSVDNTIPALYIAK